MDSRGAGQRSYARLESDNAIVSRLAQQDTVPWYSKTNLRLLYLLMFPACIGVEMTSGYDASMVSGLQAVSSWLEYYHHPHSASLGLMASMYSLGSITAVPFVSSVVDMYGRRYPILFGGILSIFGGILQGSALNFTMFVIARFILGFANVFCLVAASSLIGELSHPKERVVIGCLINCAWDLGAVSAAAIILGAFAMTSNWGWRIPCFLQIVPSVLRVSFIWFIPENPRWLISRGRGNEAYMILVKYHAEGDKDSDFVKAEYSQIEQTLEAEMEIVQMNRNAVFPTPGMRKRVIITTFLGLFTEWCGVGLISYYLAPILVSVGIHDDKTMIIVNMARTSWSFVNGIVIGLTVSRYSRRGIFLACAISVFVVFTAWTIANAQYSLTHNKVAAQIVVALIFLYSPAYNLAFTALTYPFLVELFPFHVRAKGIAIYQWWSRMAGFFTQFVNPIGIDAIGWRWYIIYCVWNAFQVLFVYVMFPETSGRTLEELTFLYEDDRGQEVSRNGEIDPLLHERWEQAEAHGSMEDDPMSMVSGRDGGSCAAGFTYERTKKPSNAPPFPICTSLG